MNKNLEKFISALHLVSWQERFEKLKHCSLKGLRKICKHFEIKEKGFKKRLEAICNRIEIEKDNPEKTIILETTSEFTIRRMEFITQIIDESLTETNKKLEDLHLQSFKFYREHRDRYYEEYQEAKIIFEDVIFKRFDNIKHEILEEILTYV